MGYDDDTLAAIQGSGGGTVGSIAKARIRWLAAADIVDNYTWTVIPSTNTAAFSDLTSDAAFASLAARHLILAEMVAQRGQPQ
ncbi:MAG: hypothetical protein R3E31_30505 [Chloroflexota bacterium]